MNEIYFNFNRKKIFPIINKFCKADPTWNSKAKTSRILWIICVLCQTLIPMIFYPDWVSMLILAGMAFVPAFTCFGMGLRSYWLAQMDIAPELAHITWAVMYTNETGLWFAYRDRHNTNYNNCMAFDILFKNISEVNVLSKLDVIEIKGKFKKTIYVNYMTGEIEDKEGHRYKQAFKRRILQIPACFDNQPLFLEILKSHNVTVNIK